VQSWAYNGDVPPYLHDPDKAKQLLDAAGYREVNGVRFHITMKGDHLSVELNGKPVIENAQLPGVAARNASRVSSSAPCPST